MAQVVGSGLSGNGSAQPSRPAPSTGAPHSTGTNKIEECDSDEMPGLADIDDDPPSPKLSSKKPAAASTRPSTTEDDDMPGLVDIDDDEEDDKKGAADSDNESMPSLASMEDSEDEAFKPKKPASTKAAPHSPTDKKKKDDDSFNALMKRSGTIKRLSDIKENEERVKRDGGAGAEAKLKSLQAERERLEASLAPGVAAKLASKPAPARPSSGTAPKPKLAQGDFDDMPPLEDVQDDSVTAPPAPSHPDKAKAAAAPSHPKDDDGIDTLMRRSNALKRLAEIKKEEEDVNRAGGAGAEAKRAKLRTEREKLELELAPTDLPRTTTKEAPRKSKKAEQEFDDMPPLEDLEGEPAPPPPAHATSTSTSAPQAPTRPPSAKPRSAPKPSRKAPPRILTPPPVAPKVSTPVEKSGPASSPSNEIAEPLVAAPSVPTLPPDAKPFDGLPKIAPPTYCLPHRCTRVAANEKAYNRLDILLLDIFRAKFLLLLTNEYLPSLLADVQVEILETVLTKTKSLDPSLPASRTLITSSIDHALGATRLSQPAVHAELGKLRMVESLHDTRCVLNLVALDRRAAAPERDLLDCRSTCVCELSTACDDLHLISLPLNAESTKRSAQGIVTAPLDLDHWEQWCAREVLSGRLKRSCWRAKWQSKILAFLKAFQKAWNAVLAGLDARGFVGGWLDLFEWLGGLRVWQEVERLEFGTVERTLEGLDCWNQLLVEAGESRRGGVLLEREWADRVKIDGDVDFTMKENRQAAVKYALACLGDSSNVAIRTNAGLARLKLGEEEECVTFGPLSASLTHAFK